MDSIINGCRFVKQLETNKKNNMTNAILTTQFFKAIDLKTKNEILLNIANHYGISQKEAFQEVTDKDAESLLDYVTGQTRLAVSLYYNRFISSL